MKTWYANARTLMREHNISTQDLADFLGLTPGAVRHYLNGTREPKPGVLGKIAKRIGVSMSELTEGDPKFARNKVEEEALDYLRQMPDDARAAAMRMLRGLVEPEEDTQDHS